MNYQKSDYIKFIGIALMVCAVIYLGWMLWDIKHPKGVAGSVVTDAPVSKEIKNMETATVVTKVIYVKDKTKAEEKLHLPVTGNPKEYLLTASGIAANRYGATVAVYHNTSTAKPRTVIAYKEAPWFAFKRDFTVGIGGGVGTQGKVYAGRARLDMLQIKEITLFPEVEFNYAERRNVPVESRAMLWAEWRP